MIRTTPFHPRLSELNTQGLYTHWQGHLSAAALHARAEARVLRGAQRGRGLRHLAAVQVPHPRARRRAVPRGRAGPRHPHLPARPGAVHAVVRRPRVRDGGRRRLPPLRDRLPAHRGAAPTSAGSPTTAAGCGSRSRTSPTTTASSPSRARARGRCSRRLMPEAHDLAFFGHTQAKIGAAPVTLSRTGYTGDLGFEVTVEADRRRRRARRHPRGRVAATASDPFGEEALMMLRIEAGLPLVDVEWHNSRLAFTDDRAGHPQASSAWAGCSAASRDGDRAFVGGAAIRRELATKALALGQRRASSSTGRLGPAAPRRRAAARQGRAPAALRVGAVRPADDRRRLAGRLRHQLHVLPRAPAAHRPRPGPPRPGRPRAPSVHMETGC